jgi:hypothetical protein
MVDVVADTASLKRSEVGSITGRVFLRGPIGDFPERGWSDFPVVILASWIEGLADVVIEKTQSFQGLFMDGPFAFVIERGVGATGRLAWGERGQEAFVEILDIAALLRSAVDAGQLVPTRVALTIGRVAT